MRDAGGLGGGDCVRATPSRSRRPRPSTSRPSASACSSPLSAAITGAPSGTARAALWIGRLSACDNHHDSLPTRLPPLALPRSGSAGRRRACPPSQPGCPSSPLRSSHRSAWRIRGGAGRGPDRRDVQSVRGGRAGRRCCVERLVRLPRPPGGRGACCSSARRPGIAARGSPGSPSRPSASSPARGRRRRRRRSSTACSWSSGSSESVLLWNVVPDPSRARDSCNRRPTARRGGRRGCVSSRRSRQAGGSSRWADVAQGSCGGRHGSPSLPRRGAGVPGRAG